jgi:DNA ligase-1
MHLILRPAICRPAICAFCLWLAPFASAQSSETLPRALLANIANLDIDPAPYLVSEKYDGVRALWDGKALYSRAGNAIEAPAQFIARLPSRPLDGELWMARGQFEKLSGIVRKATPRDDEWRQVKYMVFELPEAPGTFAERHEEIKRIVENAGFPQLVAVEQFRLEGNAA